MNLLCLVLSVVSGEIISRIVNFDSQHLVYITSKHLVDNKFGWLIQKQDHLEEFFTQVTPEWNVDILTK